MKTIAKAWNDYQLANGNVCPQLSEKITTFWAKKHPIPVLKQLSEITYFGNASRSDADIIGICQLHSDPNEAEFTAKILNANYREGDVILVEGIDSNRNPLPDTSQHTLHFPKNATIFGWEPIGFEELSAFVFESTISILTQFETNATVLKKLLKNINFEKDPNEFKIISPEKEREKYSVEEIIAIWNNCLGATIGNLIEAMGKIDARFVQNNVAEKQNSPAQISEHPFSKQLNEFMERYKSFALSFKSEEDAENFITLFSDLYERCKNCITKNKYAGWSQVQNNFFSNTWDIRQQSLSHQIKKFREQQKRVFICAGAALFFPNRGKDSSAALDTIREHKFTLGIQNNLSNATYYSFAELAKKWGSPNV
ncbi:MAG: hypothetical protein H0X29_04385 [Parachlamydiaceae bacterium]|nr:hypothetical protein [Parachlamydiaceae bacterium]